MADECDNAYAIQAVYLNAALCNAASTNQNHSTVKIYYCAECGEPIPAARRQAIPGCRLCVHCQEQADAR